MPFFDHPRKRADVIFFYLRSLVLKFHEHCAMSECTFGIKMKLALIASSMLENVKNLMNIRNRIRYTMEVSAKSSITFSISGILSPSRSDKYKKHVSTDSTRTQAPEPTTLDASRYRNNTSNTACYSRVVRRSSGSSYEESHPVNRQMQPTRMHAPYVCDPSYSISNREIESRHATANWPTLYRREDSISPVKCEPYGTWVRKSPDEVMQAHTTEKRSSPAGRFRPPPFFETVLALRKRLYYLGGRIFPAEEPPLDRNIHKLWRAMEKHKVSYSLQHYFYVASLSNRCFDLVERINEKVALGLLEGSREREVNQSYFNFLYGRSEDERHRLLCSLEKGQMSPKDFVKQKQSNSSTKTHKDSSPSCHNCDEVVKKLVKEKTEIEEKYRTLKRKYEELLLQEEKPLEIIDRKKRCSSNENSS